MGLFNKKNTILKAMNPSEEGDEPKKAAASKVPKVQESDTTIYIARENPSGRNYPVSFNEFHTNKKLIGKQKIGKSQWNKVVDNPHLDLKGLRDKSFEGVKESTNSKNKKKQ